MSVVGAPPPFPTIDEHARTLVTPMAGSKTKIVDKKSKLEKAAPSGLPTRDAGTEVVQFFERLQKQKRPSAARSSKVWVYGSLLLIIGLPTFLASIYYFLLASDQYVSQTGFAIRSNEQQASDMLGIVAGMPKSTAISDSYILTDYIESREMVEELQNRLPFREMYSRPDADFLTRLDPTVSLEKLVDYWADRVDTYFDSVKNVITVEVRAFTPDDARLITEAILNHSRAFINALSAKARQDGIKFAAVEVVRAEEKVRKARTEMLAFRTEQQQLDPTKSAEAMLRTVGELDGERSKLNSQLAVLSEFLADDAPSMRMLRSQIEAVETESARVQGQVSKPSEKAGTVGQPLANVVGDYQQAMLNQEFADKGYAVALNSLEHARSEADRQQSYLAVFLEPRVAEDSVYPRRLLSVFTVFVIGAFAWALSGLAFLTIRDHVA